ncbi:MAG: TlyA family rRNA (cytidine-2'-O)-methyltransferase [Desulfobulbus propionicus]|nr:MAG: TlyA family rRNA (cytidine-2'-O)-methyltransferase [Desulfobulbus propionicus]
MKQKLRLDELLVQRRLAADLKVARALALAGRVMVNEQRCDKPGFSVSPEVEVRVRATRRYVSRSGDKLDGALERFRVNPSGRICVDVGAATGGFTDCLLQRGAKKVYAVDVGYGILAWKLRSDSRVIVLERTNARYLDRKAVPDPVDLAVIDASFISLELLLPPLVPLFKGPPCIVALVKPQFELARDKVAAGGVVTGDALHREAIAKVCACAQRLALPCQGVVPAEVTGVKGNQEYLLLLGEKP